MPAKQRLEQQQKLAFNQSLQQSLKILELSLLELKETVDKELVENPVIEESGKKTAPEGPPEMPQSASKNESHLEDAPPSFAREVRPSELSGYEKPIPGKKESLPEILLRQLRIASKDKKQIDIGIRIIEQIDENGYMRQEIQELCSATAYTQEEITETLKLIQTFDPAGVGAKNLQECLTIQLIRKKENDPLLFKIINDHLQNLRKFAPEKLSKKLKCSKEELLDCLERIRSLEPKPGRKYSYDETVYIIPDITIEEKEDKLNIVTKDSNIPIIRVNPLYRNMLKSDKVKSETKNFIREKLRNATSLIAAIQQRKETLFKVVSIIAETQKESLLEGIDKLKPLALKEIAEATNLHESTISRVVMNKYVQTPVGIYPLRKFFSTSLKTINGEDVSASSIKMKIKELVDAEDKASPLRDQEIVELLKSSENTKISRRTVAKYRESLKIPPVSQRRRHI